MPTEPIGDGSAQTAAARGMKQVAWSGVGQSRRLGKRGRAVSERGRQSDRLVDSGGRVLRGDARGCWPGQVRLALPLPRAPDPATDLAGGLCRPSGAVCAKASLCGR